MSSLSGWHYAALFLGTTVLSRALTPLALRLAIGRGLLDVPGGHKSHRSPVPYLGGVAIAAAFSATVLVLGAMLPPRSGVDQLAAVLGVALALAGVGLVDDLRGLGWPLRLLLQLAAGAALWALGVRIDLFPHEAVDAALTVLWVAGITNAFNLLDNMDGLSAGLAAIAATGFFLIAAMNGQFLVAALAIALAGCAVGFLPHNLHPARIYMGDAGSLFLGSLLAVLGILLEFDGPTHITFFVPILVLGVAIFDTTLVVSARLLNRRSPFRGGRDHVSHRLVALGLPIRVAVMTIYGVAVWLVWLAIVMARVDVATGFLLMGAVLATALVVGILLGLVPAYPDSKRARYALREVDDEEEAVA